MRQAGALELGDGLLDDRVAPVVGFELEHLPGSVGDERVVVPGGEQRELRAWGGPNPPHDQPDRHGVFAAKSRELDLGNVSAGHLRAGQPVRDRLPGVLVDALDRGPDPLVLPSGDRERDVEFDGGVQDRPAVEGAVGPDRELPGRAGVADPADRLGQERLGAPRGAGGSAAQPAHQDLSGLRAGRQLRVVAADFRVAERGALLAATVDRDDGGVQVDRQRRGQIGGSGPDGPQPLEKLAADRVVLADVGPLVRPQPRPDCRRRPGRVEQPARGAGPQHRDVVDAVATGEHRPDHAQRLRPAVRAVSGQLQPLVHQLGQADPFSQHRRRQQPGVRHQIPLIEAHRHPAQLMRCSHPASALLFCPALTPQQGHRRR